MHGRSMTFASVAAALALLASPVLAGPPWIAVEYPANPHHPSTRNALVLIHTYHHSDPIAPGLRGVAEGYDGGERRSVPVEFVRTNRVGVYAVRGDLPGEGPWVLVVSLDESTATATALVTLNGDRRVTSVKVPSRTDREGWVIPRAVTAQEIEAELRTAMRIAKAEASLAGDGFSAASLLPLGGLLGLLVWIGRGRVTSAARDRSAA